MVFSSVIFIFYFLPTVIIAYYLLPKTCKNIFLLLVSLFFYAWGEGSYVFLMLTSILVNYFFGLSLAQKNVKIKKLILFCAISFNLFLLAYYKYTNFLIENLNFVLSGYLQYKYKINQVHLPIGISFFTFQSISYLIDIYRDNTKIQKNIFNLGLYIALFPQLIAGPIVRYNSIERALRKRNLNLNIFYAGMIRFSFGLGKKVLIANSIGNIADIIFNTDTSFLNTHTAWIGILCYTLQIYYDFSGYSDMAIGLGLIFGFNFPENFNYPYSSLSIQDFWRRWHISLSSWFRDYLYIPLGGNKMGTTRTYFNLFTVFLLCGLWHGASWNFILWGLFHGIFLVGEKLFNKRLSINNLFVKRFYTIFVIMISWTIFRIENLDKHTLYLKYMFIFDFNSPTTLQISELFNLELVFLITIGIVFSFPITNYISKKCTSQSKNFITMSEAALALLICFLSICSITASTYNPFIYFRF